MDNVRNYGLVEDGLDWVLYVTLISAVGLFLVDPSLLRFSALAPLAGFGLFVASR